MMDLLHDSFGEIKNSLRQITHKQWKIAGAAAGGTIIFWLIILFFVPSIQSSIRNNQLNSVVYPEILTEKASILPFEDLDETIAKTEGVTVIFMPNDSSMLTNATREAFNDKDMMADLNHKIEVLPVVYNVTETEKKYQLNEKKVTAIFFENGKEQNRYTMQGKDDVKSLMEKLNALPMSNVKKLK